MLPWVITLKRNDQLHGTLEDKVARPHWDKYHGWMRFHSLDADDENRDLTCSFTIGYKFTNDADPDFWTKRFKRLKDRNPAERTGAQKMMKAAVPVLVRGLELDPSRTIFVPALQSIETEAHESGVISRIVRTSAEAAGTDDRLDALSKKAHRSLHRYSRHQDRNAADARRIILEKARYKSGEIDADNVLVFDDFITRGDTLTCIAIAIRNTNPGIRVYGVALGKTERRGKDKSISNDHVPSEWVNLWKTGFEEYKG